MAREVRLVAVAAAVVLLLGAASLWLATNPPSPEDGRVVFAAHEPVDVSRLAIANAHGTMEVAFTGEGYVVDDIPAEIVDMEEFLGLLARAARVEALRTVTERPADPAPYGLAEPSARVEVAYRGGGGLALRIGGTERVTGGCYAQVEGATAVYLLAADACAPFLLPKRAYVEDLVTPRLALSSPLSAIRDVTLEGGPLEWPLTIEAVASGDPEVRRAAISLGAPTHILRGRGVYELDQTYGVEVLGSLLGITALDVVGYNLTPEDLAAMGLDRPTMRVAFDLVNGVDAPLEHYVLTLLHRDGTYWMTRNDEGVVYVVAEPAFARLDPARLPVRWFLSPLVIDVRALEVAVEGQEYAFQLTHAGVGDLRVTSNEQALETARFRTLYTLLTSAAHDGALREGLVAAGEPLLRLTYHYVDEAKPPDVLELRPGPPRRLLVTVNGVTELTMRETYLVRVREALAALWTDAPLETNW
jgi:hypothetical protein